MKRKWTTGALDANTGNFVTMNQDTCAFEDLPTCALASGSIPFALPPQHWNGNILADGGTVWDLNVDSAINACLEIVDDPLDIIIDIVKCWGHDDHAGTVSKDAWTNWTTSNYIKRYWKNSLSI